MPVDNPLHKDTEYLKKIIGHEGASYKAAKEDRLDSSPFGAYIGQGHRVGKTKKDLAEARAKIENIYKKAGVSRDLAKDLYGKEIDIGFGHMLTGSELKKFFSDKTQYKNMKKEDARRKLQLDVKNHQEDLEVIFKDRGISPKSLSKSQYHTLAEMHFQMGSDTFKTFDKMLGAVKDKDWEEAAEQIIKTGNKKEYSKLYKQTKDRALDYYKGIQNLTQTSEGQSFISTPTETSPIPASQEVPAAAGIPSESVPTPEYDTPEAENTARLSSYFSKEELNTVDKNKQRLASYFTPKELQAYQSPPTPEVPDTPISQGMAAVGGFAHGGSLGTTKKMAGAENWLTKGLNRLVPTIAASQAGLIERSPVDTVSDSFKGKDFTAGQKKYQDRMDQARKQWGKTVMASELLGGLTTGVAIPGSTILKGAGLAKKVKNVAKVGGVEGAIYGGAESDATEMSDLARDTVIGGFKGATAGAAFGGILHGGGKLYKKMKGVDVEDVVKSNMLDDKSIDVALVGADKRARKELKDNKEILKTIKGFTDKKRKDQFKFLNMTVKNAPAKLNAWAKTVTPEALVKYSADEPLNIPNSILKLAKKKKIDPKIIHAYYNWRNDIFNYMKYVNDIGGRAKASRKDLLEQVTTANPRTAKTIQAEIATFKKNMKAGLVTDESYSEYKMQQYLAEEIQNIEDIKVAAAQIGYGVKNQKLMEAVEAEAREMLVNDPVNMKSFRKSSTVSNAAELIDDKAGTNVLDVVQDLYVADKHKSGFTRGVADLMKPVAAMRNKGKYADISDEQIVRMIESGADDPLANGYRKIFKQIREYANEKGVKVDEYRLGQDQYVPMKRKGAAEMIEAMENKWKEIQDGGEIGMPIEKAEINKILNEPNFNPLEEGVTRTIEKSNRRLEKETVGKLTGEKGLGDEVIDATDMTEKMPEYATDIRYLQKFLGEVFDREIRDADQMSRAINLLQKKPQIRAMLSPSVRSVHERMGTLPMWARETDILKMATLDANNIADLIHKRPVLDRLDTQIMLLKLKKFHNSADYLNNLKKDILGITRKGTEESAVREVQRDLGWGKTTTGKAARGLNNTFMSAIYPNFLGYNPRAYVRNLTQPYTMTARELGVGIQGDILALTSTQKVLKEGMKEAQKRFSKLGLVDARDPRPEDFEGLRSGLSSYFKDSKWARRFDRSLDKYNHAAMYLYGKTDTMNRLVTAQMAEDISKLVMAGRTKWLKNAPQQVRNNVQKLLDEGASQDEITTAIGKWMQVKTQLSYAKDDMYEFGREMGPLFAMLSKWPTSITSDVAVKIMKDGRAGATRAAMKYLPLLALANVLQGGLDRSFDPKSAQSKEMFGYGGLRSWMPGNSISGITDAFIPIHLQTALESSQELLNLGGDAASGRWDKSSARQLQKVLKDNAMRFTPVVGNVMKTKERAEKLSGKTDRDKKKKRSKRKYLD